jgi:hypothetical protein
MNDKPKRRDTLKAAVAVGSLFLLGGAAGPAEPDQKNKLAGEWLNEGREDEPCAIFQQGRILLLVNEHGNFATARMTEAKKFSAKGWEDGLAAELVKEDKEIAWTNGSTWKRPRS